MSLGLKIALCAFAAILTCSVQCVKSARSGRKGCAQVLRDLKRNPPNHTVIHINIRLSKAKYICHKGFILSGSELRTCRRGRWREKEDPKCLVPKPCGRPKVIPHLKYTGSSFNFKDNLKYECDVGFKLKGPKRRKCGITGKWSRAPKCLGPCGKPSDIPHAHVEGSSYDFKDTLSYTCVRGYKLNGPIRRKCLENGVWSTAPSCSQKVCPDPGIPEGGHRFGYRTVGSTMQFSCQAGYKLHGSAVRTCLENKEWSGSLTTCQNGNTHCPILGTPVSGRKYGSSYNKGDIVKFKCNRGFVLKGSAVRVCKENRTWNGTETFCEDKVGVDTTNSAGNTRRRAIFNQHDKMLDLVFVLDASTSVTRKKFQLGLRFVKKLVKFLGTNSTRAFKNKIRTAAVTFGTDVTLHFNLGDDKASTIQKTLAAIDDIRFEGGATASADALKKVEDVVVPQKRFGSDGVLIFITDGKSSPPQKLAAKLRVEDDFEIYVIGVGRDVRQTELWQIASYGKRNVLRLKTYEDLDRVIDKVVNTNVDYSSCGGSPFDPRGRFVGGEISRRGRWPWQVAIYIVTNWDWVGQQEFHCSGSLISRQWVLTAAHCFFKKEIKGVRRLTSPSSYVLYAGVHNLTRKGNKETTQERIPKKIIPYDDDFDFSSFRNDIALVKVEPPFELKAFVRTVCLPEKGEPDLATPGNYGTVAGWGGTKHVPIGKRARTLDSSEVLKHASFQIQDDRLCENKATLKIDSAITFCAGDGEGKNDACHGDSGGAYVLDTKVENGKRHAWVAAGIVSWGDGCAVKGQYRYYTKVHPFIDWIKQKMKQYKD